MSHSTPNFSTRRMPLASIMFPGMIEFLGLSQEHANNILCYGSCVADGQCLFLLHPKRSLAKNANASPFRGLVIEATQHGDYSSFRVIARSVPIPREENTIYEFSAENHVGKQVLPRWEGTFIRFFIWNDILFASTNCDLFCLDHKWVECKYTFREQIEYICPDWEKQVRDSLSSPNVVSTTWVLRTDDNKITNRVFEPIFKCVYTWTQNGDDILLSSFTESTESDPCVGVIVYDQRNNETIGYFTDDFSLAERIRGDYGNLACAFIMYYGDNNTEKIQELLRYFPDKKFLYEQVECQITLLINYLIHIWNMRVLKRKFFQTTPAIHRFFKTLEPGSNYKVGIRDAVFNACAENPVEIYNMIKF